MCRRNKSRSTPVANRGVNAAQRMYLTHRYHSRKHMLTTERGCMCEKCGSADQNLLRFVPNDLKEKMNIQVVLSWREDKMRDKIAQCKLWCVSCVKEERNTLGLIPGQGTGVTTGHCNCWPKCGVWDIPKPLTTKEHVTELIRLAEMPVILKPKPVKIKKVREKKLVVFGPDAVDCSCGKKFKNQRAYLSHRGRWCTNV